MVGAGTPADRSARDLTSQAELGTRIIPAISDQLAAETSSCQHTRGPGRAASGRGPGEPGARRDGERRPQLRRARMARFPCVPGEKSAATRTASRTRQPTTGRSRSGGPATRTRNVAIATGAPARTSWTSTGTAGKSGFPALRQLKGRGCVGEPQAMVRTPSGGAHLYFKGTEHQRNGHIEAARVDFRSNGGYVVAPPTGWAAGRMRW